MRRGWGRPPLVLVLAGAATALVAVGAGWPASVDADAHVLVRYGDGPASVESFTVLTARRSRAVTLTAEGVPMMSGEGISGPMPLPGHTVFQSRNAYGHGCPWSCPHSRSGIQYRPEDYPVSMWIVESKICLGHEHGGIAPPNGMDLMEHYVHAFRKVLVDNLDEVADLAANS